MNEERHAMPFFVLPFCAVFYFYFFMFSSSRVCSPDAFAKHLSGQAQEAKQNSLLFDNSI